MLCSCLPRTGQPPSEDLQRKAIVQDWKKGSFGKRSFQNVHFLEIPEIPPAKDPFCNDPSFPSQIVVELHCLAHKAPTLSYWLGLFLQIPEDYLLHLIPAQLRDFFCSPLGGYCRMRFPSPQPRSPSISRKGNAVDWKTHVLLAHPRPASHHAQWLLLSIRNRMARCIPLCGSPWPQQREDMITLGQLSFVSLRLGFCLDFDQSRPWRWSLKSLLAFTGSWGGSAGGIGPRGGQKGKSKASRCSCRGEREWKGITPRMWPSSHVKLCHTSSKGKILPWFCFASQEVDRLQGDWMDLAASPRPTFCSCWA